MTFPTTMTMMILNDEGDDDQDLALALTKSTSRSRSCSSHGRSSRQFQERFLRHERGGRRAHPRRFGNAAAVEPPADMLARMRTRRRLRSSSLVQRRIGCHATIRMRPRRSWRSKSLCLSLVETVRQSAPSERIPDSRVRIGSKCAALSSNTPKANTISQSKRSKNHACLRAQFELRFNRLSKTTNGTHVA